MGWFDDVVDFVDDAADVVVDVVDDVADVANEAVGTVVGPIAEAVSAIPVVGDVVETVAPFGGMIGTFIGGPVGGVIGNAVGNAFDGDGGAFDFLDTALGAVSGALPADLVGAAGGLLDGGSFIDSAGAILSGSGVDLGNLGSLGDLAGGLLGGEGMPDLGSLGDVAGGLLGGEGMPDLGSLGDLAGGLLGGEGMPDLGSLGDLAGGLLGGEGMPDLGELGNVLGTAQSVLGGLGLGDLSSAAQGIIGDCMPDLSGPGGWLGNLPDSLPDVLGGGFDLPFGCGTFPSIPDVVTTISESGGDWLGHLAEQAGEIAGQTGGGWFDSISQGLEDITGNAGLAAEMSDLNPFDDLIGKIPGLDGDGSVQDKLQQLAETGGLGDALGNLSSNELTQLVSHLVSPVGDDFDLDQAGTPGGDGVDDLDLGLPGAGDSTVDEFSPIDGRGADLDDIGGLDDIGDAGGLGDPVIDSTFDAPADDFGGDLGDGFEPAPAPELEAPAVAEPEPVSDFDQGIAQADAVEASFDDMFEGLE